MKASELIEILTKLKDEYGDLPVRHEYDVDVSDVRAYDANWDTPMGPSLAVEIYIY